MIVDLTAAACEHPDFCPLNRLPEPRSARVAYRWWWPGALGGRPGEGCCSPELATDMVRNMTVTKEQWARALLERGPLNEAPLPITTENLLALVAWQKATPTSAPWNPIGNTSAPSLEAGLENAATTIARAPLVVAALRDGGSADPVCRAIANAFDGVHDCPEFLHLIRSTPGLYAKVAAEPILGDSVDQAADPAPTAAAEAPPAAAAEVSVAKEPLTVAEAPADGRVEVPTLSVTAEPTPEATASVQVLLNARVGTSLALDGVYGPKTEAAVVTFQRRNNLPADGIVGKSTWGSLLGVPQ